MKKVLIVEDEPVLRTSMRRGLSRVEGVEAFEAATVDEALSIVKSNAPDLVFSDLDLPGRNGLELIECLERLNINVPIVFISAYLGSFRSRIPMSDRIDVLEKPVALAKLREIVQQKILTPQSQNSQLPFKLQDYVQLAGIGGHSVEIRAETKDNRKAVVVIAEGELTHCRLGESQGREAFLELLGTEVRALDCQPNTNDSYPKNVFESWQGLLLQAVYIEDTRRLPRAELTETLDAAWDALGAEAEEPATQASAVTEAAPAKEQQSFASFDLAMDAGLEAMLDRDFDQARQAFEAAADFEPGNATVRTNLRRLDKLQGLACESKASRR